VLDDLRDTGAVVAAVRAARARPAS
jgi:hypothetical protein